FGRPRRTKLIPRCGNCQSECTSYSLVSLKADRSPSQSDGRARNLFVAVPASREGVISFEAGEHAEDIHRQVQLLWFRPHLLRRRDAAENFTSDMLPAGVARANSLRHLGIERSHSPQPPDHDRI